MKGWKKMTIALTALSLFQITAGTALGSDRVALVIGNSVYEDSPLSSPSNDARDMASALRALNFQVLERTDLDLAGMEDSIEEFKEMVPANGVAMFYFSGHGAQSRGYNYLIPIRGNFTDEVDIRHKAVSADLVLEKMESTGSRVNIMVLDACRNDPFKSFRPSNPGLASMIAPTGSFIGYATASGDYAYDGSPVGNSRYTEYLLRYMTEADLPIEEVFKRTRADLVEEMGDEQVSWESSSLIGNFFFAKSSITQVRINNECDRPLKLALRYRDIHGDWQGVKWYSFKAGLDNFLGVGDGKGRVEIAGPFFYYHAKTADDLDTIYWRGSDEVFDVDGTVMRMRRKDTKGEATTLRFTCDR